MENYIKYPRPLHLPWSPGVSSDDKVLSDLSHFEGREVVVTEKMDGENFTGYRDYCHARSIDGRHHYTRDWVKTFWLARAHDLPEGWRVCGENLYARHSIGYERLPSYFMGFSIWDEKNFCLGWNDTVEWFDLLGIRPVPVLYRGMWDEKTIRELKLDPATQEGYVVRLAGTFYFGSFSHSCAKFVRPNHVQTSEHWLYDNTEHACNKLVDSDIET